MILYHKWIGLPHVIGADPDDGIGADCVVIAIKVLADYGFKTPPIKEEWFSAAREGRWAALYKEWLRYVEETDTAAPGCLYLYHRRDQHLGMAVYIDRGFLTVSHSHGVLWKPVNLFKGKLWRLKDAAI